jgi:DNA-binding response OmpR family regulator
MARSARGDAPPKILVVDDDHDTADIMQAILTDEGYAPSVLYNADGKAVREAVTRLDPDGVLLDSSARDPVGYGESWQTAAWLAAREPSVAVIMMTAHTLAADEALSAVTKRARAADFAAVVRKPFNIDEFLLTLRSAVQKGATRRASEAEAHARIVDLREQLVAAGARDLTTSSRRVWAIFRGTGEELVQIYWWETLSLYLVGRYTVDGTRLEPLGQFTDLEAAIALALPESA